MFEIMKNALTAIVLFLIMSSTSFAQQPTPSTPNKSEEDFVTEKGFKSKVFTINYRDPGSLGALLSPLLSGFKGVMIRADPEFKTLTVRDFPENLATIEEAIKRLDTPAAPRPNIELHMHILVASNTGGATAQLPDELKDVITQLRGTLSYRNYELAASVVQRLTETPRGLHGSGTAEIAYASAPNPTVSLTYDYTINSVSLAQNPAGDKTIQIGEFSFGTRPNTANINGSVQTALNLRDGEKVVVGTTTIRDRGLIIVLTAKVLN
jgi:hypothetical protein